MHPSPKTSSIIRISKKTLSLATDAAMCSIMNLIQHRSAHETVSPSALSAYLQSCLHLTRPQFYISHPPPSLSKKSSFISWPSPITSGYHQNDVFRASLFPPPKSGGPWIIILHALMSASDVGYRKLASSLQHKGWGVAIPHLPFHYSRVPTSKLNGELAITSQLIRNSETLRQAVCETRQLITWLKNSQQASKIGLIGTSYGGWIAALTSSLEQLDFLALIQPIADVESAVWNNPSTRTLRRQLQARGIPKNSVRQHAHLSSPLHATPLCHPDKIFITAGIHDSIAPLPSLVRLAKTYSTHHLIHVDQGHFGYSALPATIQYLLAQGILLPH